MEPDKKVEKFIMCLVSSADDIICITKKSCKECAQRKLNLTILESYKINIKESSNLKRCGTRFLRVRCDCKQPQYS
jgi:hypothetical protein